MGIAATVSRLVRRPSTGLPRARRSDRHRSTYPLSDAGTVASPVPASTRGSAAGGGWRPSLQSGYLRRTRFLYTPRTMTTTSPDIDIAALIADTEGEIVRLVRDRDPSTHGLYEMVRYHLALDGSGASGGKRMRPLLGLLAYASITGEHRRALPGRGGGRARAQLLASSTTTSRTVTSSAATGPRCGRSTASRRRSTPATRCSACRASPSTG